MVSRILFKRDRSLLVKYSLGSLLFDIFVYAFLLVLCYTFIYPIYYMAIVSVSHGLHVMRGDVNFWPIGFNIDAYKRILSDAWILRSYKNTLVYVSLGTFVNIVMTSLCAYPLSRKNLRGRKFFTVLVIITMLFQGGMIPSYLIVNNLGLVNTMWAIIIPPAINVWYMMIMRTFFQNIPEEIHESAFVDGAHDLKIFTKIILPLSIPVIATMVMFYAVWHWNSFFPAMIYLHEKKLYPVQIVMRDMLISPSVAEPDPSSDFQTIEANLRYAIVIVTILPILLVYPFVQKYFVKGVMVGSLKG